ncbi:polysaccharide deacetylase family protein [Mycoplasmatota bacterium zrk1]
MREEMSFVLLSLFYVITVLLINNHDSLYISGSSLYNDIIEYADSFDYMPINARCDKVWYKVPGVDGLEVNVNESYNNMDEFDLNKIIYNELKHEIDIYDLECGPIYRGHEESKSATLIINVAWGEEYLNNILDTLDIYDTKANFFFEGRFAEKFPELVYDTYSRGHTIGNHSYSHPDLAKSSLNKIKYEISKTNNVLSEITLDGIRFFGPPSGSYDNRVIEAASELGLETIMWSVDTIDWQKPSKEMIIKRVSSKLHAGAIILMHPTENTCTALPEIINLIKKNYKIEQLDDFLS